MSKTILLSFFLLALLVLRFLSFSASHPPYQAGPVVLESILQEEPDLTNKGQGFSIKTPTNQIIFVKTGAFPRFHEGQKIALSGVLQEKVLSEKRSILTMYYPKIVVKKEADNPVKQLAQGIRSRSKAVFEQTLPPTSASLLMGIIFGAKEHFPQDFKQSLRTTGVLHVIAASGMNVTFVAGALMYILGYFLRRQTAILIASLAIIFYVFLVGFQASIIRAALMAILVFGAGMLGRQKYAMYALLLTGFFMLFFQPSWLFDVGFQLSFLATLGILVLGGGTGDRRDKGDKGDSDGAKRLVPRGFSVVGESFLTTFAAQVATLPILLGVFGSVGVLSLLVNALVLWTIPFVMTIGSLAVLVGFIFVPLAKLLLFLSLPFLLFFEAVVSFFGKMGWNIQMESFPWQMGVGYYLILLAIVVVVKQKKL